MAFVLMVLTKKSSQLSIWNKAHRQIKDTSYEIQSVSQQLLDTEIIQNSEVTSNKFNIFSICIQVASPFQT